jgi:hypothetical protein
MNVSQRVYIGQSIHTRWPCALLKELYQIFSTPAFQSTRRGKIRDFYTSHPPPVFHGSGVARGTAYSVATNGASLSGERSQRTSLVYDLRHRIKGPWFLER